MRQVFLESHNLKNRYTGFGQFNYHLIKALSKIEQGDIQFTVHAKKPERWTGEFNAGLVYKKYNSLSRHGLFRIRKKYDLWHCLNQNIKIEPYHDIPYLLTVHDIHFLTEGDPSKQQEQRKRFEHKLKRCSGITYISEFARKDTHNNFDVPDVPEFVIHNGNTLTDITLDPNYHPPVVPAEPFLYSIGDFTDRKNFITLVEMLRQLPDYHLVLSGNHNNSYGEELKDKARTYGLEERILLTGKIEDQEKQYYLQHCEAFVFPSKREGFGIPPIEAMRFGKPVFLAKNTSLPEIGGPDAFYWETDDPDHMTEVFNKGMAAYHERPDHYRKNYVERALSFNWDDAASSYMQVYHQLLELH